MRLTVPRRNRAGAPPASASAVAGVDGDGPLFSEDLLARLRRLVVVSRHTIPEGLTGEHRSKRRGSSPEFSDFKSYSQGDDFRRIDWNIYARLDELFVRLSEVTTELTIHVLLDASNSMDWRSDESLPTKARYALRVAGSLCYVSLWHFDRVVITPFGATLGAPFGPAQGHAHVTPMLRYLNQVPSMGPTDLVTSLDRYVHGRRRPGLLLLVSDLLSGEPDQLKDGVRTLRGRGWQTIVVHVVDQGELTPTHLTGGFGGRPQSAELVDLESQDRLNLLPTRQVVDRYEAEVSAWLAQIEQACDDDHTDYVRLQTDWPVESIVLSLLHKRGIVA
jgi:uncharacterized protein (DUF58 family)